MSHFLNSSIGKKLIMSLAGIFLLSFLVVHLGINLTLILFESNEPFNQAAHFMGTNVVIKVFEVVLFGGFLVHIIYGIIIQMQNWLARGKGYKKANHSQTSFFSKYMIHTAFIVLAFLVIHLMDFYIKAKFLGEVDDVTLSNGEVVHNLGVLVTEKFQIGGYVIFYVVAILFLGFHLHHGFQSAFKTLGLDHKTYTPFIVNLGLIYTIVVCAGFILIPLIIYFR